AEMAISSPLLEASIEGAHGVLLSVAGGSDLGLFEINEAAQLVAEAAHPEANIIFGAVIDDALGDEVRVTVIAAGFDNPPERRQKGYGMGRRGAPAPGAPVDPRVVDLREEPARVAAPAAPAAARSAETRQITKPAPTRPAVSTGTAGTSGSGGAGPSQAPAGGNRPSSRPPAEAPRNEPRRPVVFDDLDVPDFLK